jgi:Family of unknown function (DUF6104)
VYFTDRGIEELDDRRGDEQVSIAWLAERLRDYVDEHPEAESVIDSLATWLARLDEDDEDDLALPPGIVPGEPGDSSPESVE